MKLIIFLFALCVSIQGLDIAKQLTEYSTVAIAKWISQVFIDRLETATKTKDLLLSNLNSKTTLIPPIDDPTVLKSLNGPLNVNSKTFNSTGQFSFCTPKLTGLSKLKDNLEIGMTGGISLKWSLDIPTTIKIQGPYQLAATVDSSALFGTGSPPHAFSGEGSFLGSVDNVFMNIEATINGEGLKLSLEEFSIDFGFKNLRTKIKDIAVDGELTNLDHFAILFEKLFPSAWTTEIKPDITKQIKCAVNNVISGCSLQDIIISKLGCLNFKPSSTCFDSESEYFKFVGKEPAKEPSGYCDALESKSARETGSPEFKKIEL